MEWNTTLYEVRMIKIFL